MNEQLLRLAWALPLVMLAGVAAIHWLKRFGIGVGGQMPNAAPQVVSDLKLTEHTRFLIVEVERQHLVVLESTANVQMLPISAPQSIRMRTKI